jgi:hypothetical protein
MRKLYVLFTLLAGLAFANSAHADSITFNVAGSAYGLSGSGILSASEIGSTNVYSITGLTGTGVTGLIAPMGFKLNDNLLYLGGANLLDASGFSFTDDNAFGDFDVNIFDLNGDYFADILDTDGQNKTVPVSFSISPVSAVTPEPPSFLLLFTAMAIGVFLFRRRIFAL